MFQILNILKPENILIKKCNMYNFLKRFIDIIVSLISLILLSPFSIPIIIVLSLTAEGEVFYFQKRIGFKNTSFQIWKFATMLKNSINMGSETITLKDDFRVTFFGKFLRKTKINELPQIINILKGDISLVGPRPLVVKTFSAYNEEVKSKIYNIKPGLTGIGSIIFRDEESIISNVKDEDPYEFYKRIIAPYKGKLEMWYQENKSLILDFKLIFLTAWVIIFPNSNLYERWFIDLPKRTF